MTNKENMKKTINNDFDKKNNYKIIISKIKKRDYKIYLKYALVPVILIVITVLYNKINNNQIKVFNNDNVNTQNISITSIKDNKDNDILNSSQSSSIIINELKKYKNKQDNSSNYLNSINIPYFDILKEIKIPDDFDIYAEGRGVCNRKDNKNNGEINNYELWYKNSKNKRSIVIALSDKNIPYRDFQIDRLNTKKTIINGVEVEIYKYKDTYISIFSYKEYNFDIESCGIMEEEYIRLLYSLIKE